MKKLLVFLLLLSVPVLMGQRFTSPVLFPEDVGYGSVHKFGSQQDIDNTVPPIDIWDCPTNIGQNEKVYLSESSTVYASSSSASDANLPVSVQGLNANGELSTVTFNLGGDGGGGGTATVQVGDTSNWDRMFRAWNPGSTDYTGVVYIHTNPDAGGNGLPNQSQVVSCIRVGNGQTLMTHYTVPSNYEGKLVQFCIGISPSQNTATEMAYVQFQKREKGGVWRVMDDMRLTNNGGAFCQALPVAISLNPETDLRMHVLDVGSDNTGVWANYDIILTPARH